MTQQVTAVISADRRATCGFAQPELISASTIPRMRVPWWLKMGWSAWVAVWAPLYWRQYGAQNFLFFCDLGNFLIALALWTESRLIFSWQATGLLLFQILYTIDLMGALVSGKHLIGGTEYMFDRNIPEIIRVLSLFHLFTPPLLLWAIWRLGYDARGWKMQTAFTWIIVPINYCWRPAADVNWARGLFFRQQTTLPALLYLLSYLVLVPLVVYFPTHLALAWWTTQMRQRRSRQV